MAGNNDYGYFGSGPTGYAHYMQAHNSCYGGTPTSTGTGNHTSTSGDGLSWRLVGRLAGLAVVVGVLDFILCVIIG